MSALKDVIIDVENEINAGVHSFPAIARKLGVTTEFVNQVWEQMRDNELAQGNDYNDFDSFVENF